MPSITGIAKAAEIPLLRNAPAAFGGTASRQHDRGTDGSVAVGTGLCLRSSSASFAAVSEEASTSAVGDSLEIWVNGRAMRVAPGATVASLLVLLGVERTRVAVEKNKDVVPKKSYDETPLVAGDRVEVVTFVGGG